VFLAHPDWKTVVHSTFIPHLEWTKEYISVLVAILGTTISPYLFFWQAAQEVEEEKDHGKVTLRNVRARPIESFGSLGQM
jgi:Mn2+/Fe2+ NRAMP family transporter